MIPPYEVDKILAARVSVDEWAQQVRARQHRTGMDSVLDRLTDGPRRLEAAIGSVLGSALVLLWLGWHLGRR